MKKTIMHPDYWVEIPAGDCIIGLSDDQREHIWAQLLENAGYHERPPAEKALMEQAIEQCRQRKGPSDEQLAPFGELYRLAVHRSIITFARPQTVHLNRFYIARFPLTQSQAEEYRFGAAAHNLSGALEGPPYRMYERHSKKSRKPTFLRFIMGEKSRKSTFRVYLRETAPLADMNKVIADELGARIPTQYEWEKAARGTDGRLYPWGNEWNPDCGYFYFGQKHDWVSLGYDEVMGYSGYVVDAFPNGQSPYGVWAMMGGLPEQCRASVRGVHPRYSTAETAFIDFLAGNRDGNPNSVPVSLRMVMDNWPRQQWTGIDMES